MFWNWREVVNGLKTVECTHERRRVWYMNGEPGKLLFLKQGEETEQVWAELLLWESQRTEAISLWVQAEAGTACKICLPCEVTAQNRGPHGMKDAGTHV